MKAVVDTNVLINLLFIDQPFHREAIEIWKKYATIYIPIVVLYEFSYFLFREKKSIDLLTLVLSDKKVEIVENNANDILFTLSYKPKSYDEFNDLIILNTALRLKANLLTFDKDLEKKYRKFIEKGN